MVGAVAVIVVGFDFISMGLDAVDAGRRVLCVCKGDGAFDVWQQRVGSLRVKMVFGMAQI